MARSSRHRGNRSDEPFVRLPYSVLNAPSLFALSAHATKLLIDVAAQYRGDNNGDLSIAWKLMKVRGWRSEATLHEAKRELLDAGFLFETRKGRRPNTCSLFALTWFTLDACDKYDPGARAAFTRGEYRIKAPLAVVGATAAGAAPTARREVARPALLHVMK